MLNAVDTTATVRDDPRVWPYLLAELVDVLADHNESKENMAPDEDVKHAQATIIVIAHHLGGRNTYLPRNERLKRAIRDATIYRSFNGSNHRKLAKKTKLTIAQIYNIICKERTLRQNQRQMTLWSE